MVLLRKLWFMVTLVIMFTFENKVSALLKCYTCSANSGGTDCETNPDVVSGGITNCDKRYCTLRRIELKSTGLVTSFYRNCEDNPMYVDKIIEDDTYRTFFRACAIEMCNGGNGRESYAPAGGNQLPPGIFLPPFNDRVLHMFASGARARLDDNRLRVLMVLTFVVSLVFGRLQIH